MPAVVLMIKGSTDKSLYDSLEIGYNNMMSRYLGIIFAFTAFLSGLTIGNIQ